MKARISQAKANKYTTKKTIKKLNEELAEKEKLVKLPITAESWLKDCVVKAAFLNKRHVETVHNNATFRSS